MALQNSLLSHTCTLARRGSGASVQVSCIFLCHFFSFNTCFHQDSVQIFQCYLLQILYITMGKLETTIMTLKSPVSNIEISNGIIWQSTLLSHQHLVVLDSQASNYCIAFLLRVIIQQFQSSDITEEWRWCKCWLWGRRLLVVATLLSSCKLVLTTNLNSRSPSPPSHQGSCAARTGDTRRTQRWVTRREGLAATSRTWGDGDGKWWVLILRQMTI